MSLLNREQNARAARSAAAWQRRAARRIRREDRGRHELPPPKAPRLPKPFAASASWSGVGGRDGIARVVVTL